MSNPSDFWNERYQRDEYIFGTEANDFIRAMAPFPKPGMKAFAPADGEGRNGVYLAGIGYDVVSVDVSNLAVDKALHLAASAGVNIDARVGDLFEYEWPEDEFDLIIICFMHFIPADHDRFVSLIKQSLKPGGMLIMENYTQDQMTLASGGPKNLDMLLTEDRIRSDWQAFEFEVFRCVRRHLAEGPRHRGEAAVAQLVARKPL